MGKFVYMYAPKNAVGFCGLHKRYMSLKQMQAKRCRQKQCRYFYKCKTHPWWVRKEQIKEIKKNEHQHNDRQID